MNKTLKVNSILLFLYINLVAADSDKCKHVDYDDATCILATDCPVAVSAIRKQGYHNFERCGFRGVDEIVCCPNTSNKFGSSTQPVPVQPTPSTRLTRVADVECQKIVDTTNPSLNLHILGGEEAANGEFPHMVALGFDKGEGWEFDCGGSLVSKDYVLTAAHCIERSDKIEPGLVRVGVVALGDRQWHDDTDFRVAEIKLHPKYTRKEKYNDLALIRLQNPVEFSSSVKPACLYTGAEDPQIQLIITGWGVTNIKIFNSKSNLLLKANVTVFSRSECVTSYASEKRLPRGVVEEQLCAGDREGIRDTCQGDSGGPLQGFTGRDGQYRIIGITSFGRGCGVYPGIYTRVSNYLDWIESVVWPN